MKKNSLILLLNPFTRIAGWKAFFLGIFIVAITLFVSQFSHTYFDGAIDAHFSDSFDLKLAVFYQAVALVTLVLSMYLITLPFIKGVRFQDMLGTITFARFPFLLMTIFGIFVDSSFMADIGRSIQTQTAAMTDIFKLGGIIIVMAILGIWSLILLFNAFKVSSGLKSSKLFIAFFIGLFIAEIISKIIIYLVPKYLF